MLEDRVETDEGMVVARWLMVPIVPSEGCENLRMPLFVGFNVDCASAI